MMAIRVMRTRASAAFFDAAAEGALLLSVCEGCGTARIPTEDACFSCQGTRTQSVRARGTATLVSWSVVHRSMLPGLDAPYVVGLAELAEGPWALVRLVAPSDMGFAIGDPLTLTALPASGGGEALIVAVPAEDDR